MQIRDILQSVSSDRPSETAVAEFVGVCKNIALILLRKKAGSGKLHLNGITSSLDDLALDCVADLFSRNDKGEYTQIRVYLDGINLRAAQEAELMSHVRRLVFSRVNQGIFRLYHDTDPSLSRIIRNMKLSVQALHNFTIVDRFGEPFLKPLACDPLEDRPIAGPEIVRDVLLGTPGKTYTIPDLMSKLYRCLREQDRWCRLLPLIQVALIFRSLFGTVEGSDAVRPEAENNASVTDATGIIADVCFRVRNGARKKYVESGKVTEEIFGHYFTVIENALVRVILDRDGEEISYFEELSKLLPGLTRAEYRAGHKARIEYLGRLAHKRALSELRKMF
jgi:hypothetical protein